MNISTAFSAGRLTIYLAGELDHHEARCAIHVIDELLDEYLPRDCALDMVRPGIMTYGMYPSAETGGIELKPAMSLRSRIYAINELLPGDTISYGRSFVVEKPMRVAVIPIGYADGLSRCLSGQLEVIIHGQRCRQIGRICMDMCMVDISNIDGCRVEDIVTIIGTDGNELISADELAQKQGSINYEVTCDVAPRVPRIYL